MTNRHIRNVPFIIKISYLLWYVKITYNKHNKQKKMKKTIQFLLLFLAMSITGFSQITTSTISGIVKNGKGEVLSDVTIHALHEPTGTNYYSKTNKSGAFVIPSVRVGGPYTVHASSVGFRKGELKDVNTSLGLTENVEFILVEESTQLKEVVVIANKGGIFSKEKTGAAQQFSRRELTSIPITGARTIDGITKYNPFGNGNSFGAQDSRLNNFTIDGSQFNNNFGLGSSAQAR